MVIEKEFMSIVDNVHMQKEPEKNHSIGKTGTLMFFIGYLLILSLN